MSNYNGSFQGKKLPNNGPSHSGGVSISSNFNQDYKGGKVIGQGTELGCKTTVTEGRIAKVPRSKKTKQFDIKQCKEVKVFDVTQAKEYSNYLNLPKYSHVNNAVINPSPIKRRASPKKVTPNVTVYGSPSKRFATGRSRMKEVPEELIRPVRDEQAVAAGKREFNRRLNASLNKSGRSMSPEQKIKAKNAKLILDRKQRANINAIPYKDKLVTMLKDIIG